MSWGVIESWRFEVVEVTRVTPECYFYKNGNRERRAWRTKLIAQFEHQSTALRVAEKLTERLETAYRRAGGIARIARGPNGAMAIRNIANLEATALFTALRSPVPRELREAISDAAERLIDQQDEPDEWTNYGTRMNYWRDKAIHVARDLLHLIQKERSQ